MGRQETLQVPIARVSGQSRVDVDPSPREDVAREKDRAPLALSSKLARRQLLETVHADMEEYANQSQRHLEGEQAVLTPSPVPRLAAGKEQLERQRGMFGGKGAAHATRAGRPLLLGKIGGGLTSIRDRAEVKFPGIDQTLGRIQNRRHRETIVLATVISICVFLIWLFCDTAAAAAAAAPTVTCVCVQKRITSRKERQPQQRQAHGAGGGALTAGGCGGGAERSPASEPAPEPEPEPLTPRAAARHALEGAARGAVLAEEAPARRMLEVLANTESGFISIRESEEAARVQVFRHLAGTGLTPYARKWKQSAPEQPAPPP
eukprot:gene26498-45384_t